MNARLLVLLAALAGGSVQAQHAQHPGHGAAPRPYAGMQDREIKALSAEGRLSSIILSVLPLLLFMALLILNPVFLRPLFTTSIGLMMMGGSVVLMLFGVFWLKKITEIKV